MGGEKALFRVVFQHRPRVCGGGPMLHTPEGWRMESSPCVRGWTAGAADCRCTLDIVPVCAGVDRRANHDLPLERRHRPRVCGGGPGGTSEQN